ncbi:transmembrane protein 134 isoform X2 [Wyeomyia smithii]|uniref:transmembrane protein 134 isoform X2 n=1 Tax=Wyeomyia smithii TaxID=174621 RepID=UPI002467D5C7|nr:transmembrane protein 134 isoform X2 [Wyeomyia smithii]
MNSSSGSSRGPSASSGKEPSKRFSIHDAFEEETDEVIKVYGSTVISTPMRAKVRSPEDITIRIQHDQRDSDSLIQEYGNLSSDDTNTYCWRHPKVRENWRTVLAAATLLVIGTGLIAMGAYAIAEPHNGSQAAVFFVAGFICFVPGAYHVVYIWLAARGYRGFDFYHLPLFT